MKVALHFRQFYQMRIIRITLLKLQALKLSEVGWKYLRNYWGIIGELLRNYWGIIGELLGKTVTKF